MKKKILLIDDDASFARMVKLSLEESGDYEVVVENKGSQGRMAARKAGPDLILLDIMMPDADGFKVLESLKKDGRTVSIPVVMLTAVGTDEAKIRAAEMYNEGYLVKPVTTEALKAKIEKALALRGK